MLALGRSDDRAYSHFSHGFARPRGVHTTPNVTSIEKKGGEGSGCPADVGRRRRHQGEATKGKEGDAAPDLFLKHLDATLATYV